MKVLFIFSLILFLHLNIFSQPLSNTPNTIDLKMYFEDEDCILNWKTSREVNSSYFIIEKAGQNGIFEAVKIIKASGYSNLPVQYEWKTVADSTAVQSFKIILVAMDGIRTTATCSNETLVAKKLNNIPVIEEATKNNVPF